MTSIQIKDDRPMKSNSLWVVAAVALFGVGVAGLSGCKQPKIPDPVVPKAAAVVTFVASSPQASKDEPVTLSWEVQDATSVQIATLSGQPVELADPSARIGSVQTKIEQDTIFVLTARGEGGSDQAAVSVMLKGEPPSVTFSAIPSVIDAGQAATLVWNAPGATTVTIKDGAGALVFGGVPQGSLNVTPAFDTTYTLDSGDGRTAQVKVTVNVAIIAFAATPEAAQAGDMVTLNWKVGGAEKVTLSAEGRGVLYDAPNAATNSDGSFVDTLPASLPANGQVVYTLVATQGARTVQKQLTVYTGADPVIVSFVTPQYARTGGQYQISWKTLLADRVDVIVDGVPVHRATTQAEVDQGSLVLDTPSAAQKIVLEATNTRGGKAQQTATVLPVGMPTLVSFNGNPATVAKGGDPVTLSWNVTNARHVKVSVKNQYTVTEVSGVNAETGSVQVYPNKQTEYVLEADNTLGDAIAPQSFVADVTSPAQLVFSTEPVPDGAPIQLTGTTVNGPLEAMNFAMKNATGDAFEDISLTGDPLPVVDGDDDNAYLVQLPHPFQTTLGGNVFGGTALSVSINGWMVFSETTQAGVTSPSTSFPTTNYPASAFVPFGKNLKADAQTHLYFKDEGTGAAERLIVQWSDVLVSGSTTKRLTFEAQVHADGHVVFAYDKLGTLTATDKGAVGVVSPDGASALTPTAKQLTGIPAAADTYRFYGSIPLPLNIYASSTPMVVRVQLTQGAFLEIEDAPAILPPNEFFISEINYHPAASAPFGEWFEVTNNTSTPKNLQGWSLNFGLQGAIEITQSLVLPANGTLVFGQSADPAQNGGVTVDFAYPSGISLDDTSGTISLDVAGGAYSSATWKSSQFGGTGKSVRFDPPSTGLKFASGYGPAVACDGTGTYGTQIGTPGQKDPRCFQYALAGPTAPNGFQSILATGAIVGTLSGSSGTDQTVATLTLPRPIKMYGQSVSTLYVSSNGWLSPIATTAYADGNDSTPSTSLPNAVIAPYWDDEIGNTSTAQSPSSVMWQQFDPDGTPGSGDEYTLVSWENWKCYFSTSSLNFQVKFLEATGDIEFHFGAMASSTVSYGQGGSATTWIESFDGRYAAAANVNSTNAPGIQPFTGFKFTYQP